MSDTSQPVKTLIALAIVELCMNAAVAQKVTAVITCPGVYEFYGPPFERTGLSALYYMSSGKAPLIQCLKNSRMAGAKPLAEYLNKLPKDHQQFILSVKDKLQIKTADLSFLCFIFFKIKIIAFEKLPCLLASLTE